MSEDKKDLIKVILIVTTIFAIFILSACNGGWSIAGEDITPSDSISTDFIKDSISKKSSYIYLCSNETINGLEFREDGLAVPSRTDTNNKIMVVDMSSDILSKRINWDNIDIAFACSPKNFGFPGSA